MRNAMKMRDRIRRAICDCLLVSGTLSRDAAGHMEIGGVRGYRYRKRSGGAYVLAMPGQIAEQTEGLFFMALYPDALPHARRGDTLTFEDGATHDILSVSSPMGAYDLYCLSEGDV